MNKENTYIIYIHKEKKSEMDKCRKTIPIMEINKCIECPSIREIGAFYSVLRRRNQNFLLCTQEKKSELSTLYSGEEIRAFYSVLRRRNQSFLHCTQEKKSELSTLYSGEEIRAFFSVLRRRNQSVLHCTQEKKSGAFYSVL